jgi:hypothetical protein
MAAGEIPIKTEIYGDIPPILYRGCRLAPHSITEPNTYESINRMRNTSKEYKVSPFKEHHKQHLAHYQTQVYFKYVKLSRKISLKFCR